MDIVFVLLPIALTLGGVGLIGMLWAVKTGQFEDLEGPAHRILFDDDREMVPDQTQKPKIAATTSLPGQEGLNLGATKGKNNKDGST
ncbi:MAG: cytochrome oxidase [Magnetococcales bacterium]|nr:cytochrome oxidase [Magnetococcales bacterium]HIJ83377.1 cbb3-type cytochrome oxidase assembly protein CcoS [Magnetococcales bacterium]